MIFNINIESKNRFFVSIISTICFFLLSHGYRLTRLMNNHDSIAIYRNDSIMQGAFGRIFQMIVPPVFGAVNAPWLIMIVSCFAISITVYLICDMFCLCKVWQIIAIAGISTCNFTITQIASTYISWMDSYLLALLFSVLSIWIVEKKSKRFWPLSFICMVLCLGLYAAYFDVALGLVCILLFIELNNKKEIVVVIKKAIIYLVLLIAALVFYYISWKIFLGASSQEAMNSVNSLSALSFDSIMKDVIIAYSNYFSWFFNPYLFESGFVLTNITWKYLLIIASITCYVLLLVNSIYNAIKTKKIYNCLLQILIIIIFPLAINFVGFLTHGIEHDLMVYSFIIIFWFVIAVYCDNSKKLLTIIIFVIFGVAIWNNVVYSNHVYVKKAVQENATLSYMTRLLDDIESTDGYIIGETPVVIIGNFYDVKHIKTVPGMDIIDGIGMNKSSVTYLDTVKWYFDNVLLADVNVVAEGVDNSGEIPCYPERGSIFMNEGIMYIKVSD